MSQIGVNDLASKRILLGLIPLLPLSADGITRMQGSLLSVVCLFQGACGDLKDQELSLGEEGARGSCRRRVHGATTGPQTSPGSLFTSFV